MTTDINLPEPVAEVLADGTSFRMRLFQPAGMNFYTAEQHEVKYERRSLQCLCRRITKHETPS